MPVDTAVAQYSYRYYYIGVPSAFIAVLVNKTRMCVCVYHF